MKHQNKTILGLTLAAIIALSSAAQSIPPLINYQGQLTDRTGAPLVAGVYSVQFKLWNDPLQATPANLIWGQQQSVSILSNGVFNAILGSPVGSPIPDATPAVNNLAYAFAGSNCFLGLTVISSPSGAVINPSEIQPRQQLLSAPFAVQAQQAQVASSVIPGSIVNASLTAGLVTLTNLAPRQIGTNVGIGGMAISLSSGPFSFTAGSPNPDLDVAVSNLTVTIATTGRRPVMVLLVPDPSVDLSHRGSYIGDTELDNYNLFYVTLYRGSTRVSRTFSGQDPLSAQRSVGAPGAFSFIDLTPPAGTNTYSIYGAGVFGDTISFNYVRMVVYEL